MRLRPIPKILLADKCEYKEYKKDTGEGSLYLPSITLKNIRIDEQKQYTYNSNGKELIGNAIMYYDIVNSKGLSSEPKLESIVKYNNTQYTVKSVDILKEFDKIHHYEVLLK